MSDPEDLFGEEEETPQETDGKNPFKQLRTHANKLEKQVKSQETELEELRTFKAGIDQKTRADSVGSIFTELGLNPAQAKLYELAMPEVEPSKETVGKWAVEYGLAQATDETAPTTGFTPTTTPEGIAPGQKRLTLDEWLNLNVENPEAGAKALAEGRVDRSQLRVGLGPDK